ncbi:DNA gyrase subunit A [Lachnospiraceae bacterium TWA4]|nr:DNA gyrase subunit A [Lachnospiraceae bacterium TWA4]
MIAIENGYPVTLDLKHILESHIQFQIETNTRKYTYLLKKETDRLEIEEGLIRAIDAIDLIIQIIRSSKSQVQAKKEIASQLELTERQAQAILDLRLSKLIRLEVEALEKEHRKTLKNIKTYKKILSNSTAMQKVIEDELTSIKETYATPRKTAIIQTKEISIKSITPKAEKLLFLMDRFGYVKTVSERSAQKISEDEYIFSCPCMSDGKLQLFTSNGRMHQVKVFDLPQSKSKDKGIPIDNISTCKFTDERILYIQEATNEGNLLFITAHGLSKKVLMNEFITNNRNVAATKLQEDDELVYVGKEQEEEILLHSKKDYYLRFKIEEIPLLKKNSQGVKSMDFISNDTIKEVLQLSPTNEEYKKIRLKNRNEKGIKPRKKEA